LETPCGVTIAKLAEEQGLSRRTVYRYLATLQEEFRIVEEDGRWRSIGGVL
jgi:DNA-binding IclR family transcriptional regulator